MRKLFLLKKGRINFYACLYDCGMYTIDRITKGFGGIVTTFETLEELEKYAAENGYKKHNNRRRGCTPEPLPAAVLPVREYYFFRRIYK